MLDYIWRSQIVKRIAVLAILCLIAIGCDVQESKLTLENAINHLNSQGIEIVEVEVNEVHENHALDIILNDVKPNFFYVKDEQLLTIWVFSSHSDLELGLEDFEDKTATAMLAAHERYRVDNLFIVYSLEGQSLDHAFDKAIRRIN